MEMIGVLLAFYASLALVGLFLVYLQRMFTDD